MSSSSFLSTALQVLFIALKLTGQITWSWWLVMLPTLVPLGLVFLFALAYIVLRLTNRP
jgi:hypothetical protein